MRYIHSKSMMRQMRGFGSLRDYMTITMKMTGRKQTKLVSQYNRKITFVSFSSQKQQLYSYYSTEAIASDREKGERERVVRLSEKEKDMELRQLNREIALLKMKLGINTGDLYTYKGKISTLIKDYGIPFIIYDKLSYITACLASYVGISLSGINAASLLASYTSVQVDPAIGTVGLALATTELIEPLRFFIIISTTKSIVDYFYPVKY
mmetsp:Transcript_30739/g.35049  ORF Transcript_30739/g.35049 Transcript_30739/m.35049 type:complete len:209 (+) Transcript_30739:81-707(+)